MEPLSEQFNDALTRIEISGANLNLAINAHKEVREYLEQQELLGEWGINSVLIGSYARKTGIYPGKDVDIFMKLEKLNLSASPTEIHQTIFKVLFEKYGDRVDMQNRSVKVAFKDESTNSACSVDAVPAVKFNDIWAIPSRDKTLWISESEEERWIPTNPEKLSDLTNDRNAKINVNGRGAYVPIIKLIKQVRSAQLSKSKPGGLFFELLCYWAFEKDHPTNSFAELIESVLRSIVAQLESIKNNPLIDPTLQQPFEHKASPQELSAAHLKFSEISEKASEALELERCPAAIMWRSIFGNNDRGFCFSLPEGCDESGKELTPIVAIKSKGSEEADGFGTDRIN